MWATSKAVRGADRSNPQVNEHYEDALADLAAYEDEKRRETLRGMITLYSAVSDLEMRQRLRIDT